MLAPRRRFLTDENDIIPVSLAFLRPRARKPAVEHASQKLYVVTEISPEFIHNGRASTSHCVPGMFDIPSDHVVEELVNWLILRLLATRRPRHC